MKEIGGYMEFETYHGKEFHDGLIALNTARSSIQYVINTKNYTKIYLPIFLCDCIYKHFKKRYIDYEFYHIDTNWLPMFDKNLLEHECILIVNYYGQLTNQTINHLKSKYSNILLDNTQSFFQEPVTGVDTIYNCRKYFGVTDGSYLFTDVTLKKILNTDLSYNRFDYLIGRYECGATQFYKTFTDADERLKEKPLMAMSKLTQNIMKSLNYKKIESVRIDNFNYLHYELSRYNKYKDLTTGTYMYPFMCNDAKALRESLIASGIYIPILWPNVIDTADIDSIEYCFANNILPLPIDHRYHKAEMSLIVSHIKNYLYHTC